MTLTPYPRDRCQGYADKDVVRGKTYTLQECKALVESQLAAKGAEVLRRTKEAISQNEYDAYLQRKISGLCKCLHERCGNPPIFRAR